MHAVPTEVMCQSAPVELELQMVVNFPRTLGSEQASSGRAAMLLTTEPPLQPLCLPSLNIQGDQKDPQPASHGIWSALL